MEVPNILSMVTYFPALAALMLLFIPRGSEQIVKVRGIPGFSDRLHSLAPSRLSL